MRITIDNLDGKGPVDYSSAICAETPLKIERTLNSPSRCSGALVFGGIFMSANPNYIPPVRRARVVVSSDSGLVLFTGYLAMEPEQVYAGQGCSGAIYRVAIDAISDEWLLDKQTTTLTGAGFQVEADTLIGDLAQRTVAGALTATIVAPTKQVGVFVPETANPFSANAGAAANSACAIYRAVNGELVMQPVGNSTHSVNFDDGSASATLQPAALKLASVKQLANDVTITGEIEPSAYVTEIFQGDGTTNVFQLAQEPLHLSRPTLLADSFNAPALDTQMWSVADPGAHVALGAGGLMLSGGTGLDGHTTLTALNQVELGGTVILEAANVQLTSPSDGVLCGLYTAAPLRATCFAGYNVRQSAGATIVTPFVNGAEVGASYTLLNGYSYTLRIRLHSPEMQRVLQSYYARVDGTIQGFGGGSIASPMSLVFDIVDLGNATNTPATVLYDGSVATSPAACTFAAINALQLFGSIGAVSVKQSGSAWITSAPAGGMTATRLSGVSGSGADYQMDATGRVTFFTGRIPAAGELITVRYRTRNRAVARLEDPASVTAEAAGGVPGTARWLGKVIRPQARSSADCEAAAQAVLAIASSRAAAVAGNFSAVNPTDDIWPGDVLNVTANGQTLSIVVRTVAIADGHAAPELLIYKIAFANDWAESLGITLSEAVATDAYLPPMAASAPAQVLANLQQLAVTSATTSALAIDAGIDPPAGGGFEVRRRDWEFGPGPGADLVLRSPVRTFTIPRAFAQERFYIRMYDASATPLYSRLSAAVFTNLPVA